MATYTEINNNKPINWYEELNKATINWKALKRLSGNWITCACGNQCNIIPRSHGAPVDDELKYLGLYFHEAIEECNITQALSILNQIEKRSAYLINEIKSLKNQTT